MSVTLRVCFPLGAYHATAWDRGANSGEPEWPPSPWRILRALLSTWHTRCADRSNAEVDALLAQLASERPRYLLPRTSISQTRHYMPQPDRRGDFAGKTVLTVDGRLHLGPSEPVWVQWPTVELNSRLFSVLADLASHVPYLGRSESVCKMRLVDTPPQTDEPWAEPAVDDQRSIGTEAGGLANVLVPECSVTRAQLEATTGEMRKQGRLVPEGARWCVYRVPTTAPKLAYPSAVDRRVTSVRWAVGSTYPFLSRNGMLASEAIRRQVISAIKRRDLQEHPQVSSIVGAHGNGMNHQHAHWLYLTGLQSGRDAVNELALWVPGGIPGDLLPAVLDARFLPRYEDPPRGYVPANLYLTSLGDVDQVLPELTGESVAWRTATPLTTSRFQKHNKSSQAYWHRTVERAVEMHKVYDVDGDRAVVKRVDVDVSRSRLVREVRRHRSKKESMARTRRAAHLTVRFVRPVRGPLVLGDLAHFGLGTFEVAED